MANTKHVKKTLACSVLALTASVTAFVGTTFAWFTDSASAGQNTIVTGNLDVEFWHCPNYESQWGHGFDEAGASQIEGDTALFLNNEGKPMLWEPNASTGETFRVKNAGTLALKYRFRIAAINATQTAEGNDLTDILSMQIIELDPTESGAPGASTAEDAVYYDGYFGEGYVIEHTLLPGESDDFNVAIDWYPSIRDNEFNVKGGLELTFVVDLLATQTTYESDSTDDQYDKDADYDGEISNVTSLEAAFRAGGEYKLIKDIETTSAFTVAEGAEVTLDLNGKTITSDTITNNGKLTIDGAEAGAAYALRRAAIGNAINATIANNGELIVNGATISAASGNAIVNSGDLTVKNGTIVADNAYAIYNTGDVTVENGTISGINSEGGSITIENGTIYTTIGGYSHAVRHVSTGALIINGGLFSGNGNEVINANSSPATINGGTFTKVEKGSWLINGSNTTINDGTFNAFIEEGKEANSHRVNNNVTVKGGTFNYNYKPADGFVSVDNKDGTYTVLPDVKTESGNSLEGVAGYAGLYTDDTNYYVFTAQGLISMRNFWKANWIGNDMWGRSYNIMANIDATGYTWNNVWVNVGSNDNDGFVFDGHGHTITGLTITDGLFSGTPNGGNKPNNPGYVKDITFDKVNVVGDHFAGVLWSNVYNELVVENVTVKNSTITGACNVAALVGGTVIDGAPDASVTFNNCVVKDNIITATGKDGQDPNGAAAFISRAYGNTTLTFDEKCVSDGNTISSGNGLVGGGIYGYTVWVNGGFAGTGSCDDFTKWDGLVSDYNGLKAAIAAGKTEILLAGKITLAGSLGANGVTLIGVGNDAGIDYNSYNISASNGEITYKNLSLFAYSLPNIPANGERYGWYGGIDYVNNVSTYVDCTITGVFTPYGSQTKVIGCTFIPYLQDGEEFYNIFQYSGDVYAKDCTFNYLDRAIKIYKEAGGDTDLAMEIVNCEFVAYEGYKVNKALINIDASLITSVSVVINGITIDEKLAGVALYSDDAKKATVTNKAGEMIVCDATQLQNALNKAADDTKIKFVNDISGDVTVNQPGNADINIVIDGDGYKYDGTISIKGNSDFDGDDNDSLLIKNINFVTSTASEEFIWSADSQNGSMWRYAHNVTVDNCTFTASGAAVYTAVGVKFQQAYNISVTNCTATNMHSLLQAESCGSTVTVDNATVVNGKNGVSFNNTMNAIIKNSTIEANGDGSYGVRHKGEVDNYKLTVENCKINAFIPVLIRNVKATGYIASFKGENTLTATNTIGYQIVVSAGDWDDDSAEPTAPAEASSYTITGVDAFKCNATCKKELA